MANLDNCSRCERKLGGDGPPYWDYMNDKREVVKRVCDICYNCEYLEEFKEKGIISTKLLTTAALANCHAEYGYKRIRNDVKEFELQNKPTLLKLHEINEEFEKLIEEFEKKHWNTYLKAYWNNTSYRGHIAKCGKAEALMWGSAGRVLITLRKGDADITMIFSDYVPTEEDRNSDWYMAHFDKECTGGLQGINAKYEEAKELLQTAVAKKKFNFKEKKEVRLAGL